MASKCRKFVPNIFNKTKCQTCFGSKDQHSAEALENNKASRKVSKCGYLFVAPGYDFNNPLDKSKRWQRRFFRLYDDGELAYSVDENPDTVPQGVIDMNKCTDVKDATGSTSHSNSMAIITPEKTTYIKGNSKEEIQWWYKILHKFAEENTVVAKPKFFIDSSNKENIDTSNMATVAVADPTGSPIIHPKSQSPPDGSSDESKGHFEVEKVRPKDQAFSTYRGVRSMKHTKADKHHQEGLRKSSSLHDLTAEEKESGSLDNSRFLSRSGDRLDSTEDVDMYHEGARLLAGYGDNPYATLPRTPGWKSPSAVKPLHASSLDSSSNSSIASAPAQSSNTENLTAAARRGSFDDKNMQTSKSRNASERARLHRERSASMKSFPANLSLPKIASSAGSAERLLPRGEAARTGPADGHENETDEHKMAKSSELQSASRSTPPPPSPTRPAGATASTKFEDLMYMKKGWLIKMGSSEKDWKKHWFVLTGNSLRYYKDAKAEETNSLDGRIDLSSCYEISEVQIQRNYGFKIKTRNGEYILSAMTSGIRSNWMKAIRLCMDLQSGNKGVQSKPPSDMPTTTINKRPSDDMQLNAPSAASRLKGSGEHSRAVEKREFTRNIRRHYSDVNPGNIGKMFSLKGATADKPQSGRTSSTSSTSSKEPSIERDNQQDLTTPSPMDHGAVSKPGKYEQFWPSGDGSNLPFRRFVEGSDSHVTTPAVTAELAGKAGDKSDEEERKRRAKSPSAKIKERSRAKSPKLHSPPPGHEAESKFEFQPQEEDKMSLSSDDLDYRDGADNDEPVHLDADDNLASTMSSAGEGMLVDLLENEVESLKERLEHTQHELAKSHDSNRDLKTKLQTVVRDKDSSSQLPASIDSPYTAALAQPAPQDPHQMNMMKRQLKDAKDAVQRQKTEIDQLKSKLDMSISKLTGTEKALSEALKDVKQEKDKFLKVTTEYNRKVRTLEGQLKEVTQKMEKYHENSLIKDKENRRLDLETKQNQQKLRDHEREILKLKAVEHEYRQMKVDFDEREKIVSRMRAEIKEKDDQFKKMEIEYEEQFENIMQDFSKERDGTEQHLEDLKSQLLEAQRKSSMSDQLSQNVANIIREKDEIISQLEEKVIENESKLSDLNEELKADEEENSELQNSVDILQEERDNSMTRMKELEQSLSHYQTQNQRMEKENASIRKHMDDLRKENTELSERFNSEKSDQSRLAEDNDSLKSNIKDLELEVHNLHENLTKVVNGHDRLSESSNGTSQELLHTFVLVTAEMNDVSDNMVNVKKTLEGALSNFKGDQKLQLTKVAEMLEDVGGKCENITDILREGSASSSEPETVVKQKSATLETASSNAELDRLKKENKEIQANSEQTKKEMLDVRKTCSKLQTENEGAKENIKNMTEKYQNSVGSLNKKMDEFISKNKLNVDKKSPKKPSTKKVRDSSSLSGEIEEQLTELEDKIGKVEKVLQTQDLSISSVDTDNLNETEDDSDAESEESEAFTDSEEETEDSDGDTHDDSTVTEGTDNLLGKLKEMKHQLQMTNNRIKDLTGDITDLESSTSGVGSESGVESELRQTLLKCGEKIDSLTVRLSDGLKTARTEMPQFSDNTWAFQKCVNKLKEKVAEVSHIVHSHDDLNAKDMKVFKEKLHNLTAYVNQVDKLGENDWDIAGKIAKQELKFQHLLSHKEKATKQSTLRYEDRLQLYADKLAFEAMILGQMAILIQRQQVGTVYKDVLLKEIHEANLQILELERRIDSTSSEMNPTEQENDLVSSYASILAEKITLEGQLASCAMVQDLESSENVEVLSALNVHETPAVLAMEIFLRSQVDSSVNQQLQKFAESMDGVSNHIVTRAIMQGEITHALKTVKKKFKAKEPPEDLSSCVSRERQFAYEQLESRHKMILDLVNETEPMVMTTLIQLIEFTQGTNSPTLDSVCDKMTDLVHKKIQEYEKQLQNVDSETKAKIENIIAHLHTELEDAVPTFREEYHCYVQTASPDIDPNVLKFSTETLCVDLAGIFIQKAVIDGTFAYVSDLYMSAPDIAVSQMMDHVNKDGEGLSDLAKALGQILLTEASNKQKLAAEVRDKSSDSSSEGTSNVTDLVGLIPDLEAYPQSFDAYAATLVREAMFQSQLTYTTYKLKLEYHRELRDIKLKMDAGEKVVLPSEISREAESDIQVAMTVFEEILETKYQDECAVLSQLESDIGKVKTVSSEKSCSKCKNYETKLKQLEKAFQQDVLSTVQERQNVHMDVLRQGVTSVLMRVDRFLEDHEKEKETVIENYEDRILTLQDEFDMMRVDHEEELEQVKQDIMTAVSAIKATEDEAETTSLDQLRNHNKQLIMVASMCKELLAEIKNNVGSAAAVGDLDDKIEAQLTNIVQIESDPSFTLDISLPSPDSPSPPVIPQDPPQLERSLQLTRSDENIDKLLERSQHEHEMELLKREKEEALADEIKVTKAALDAMRKAYEEELETEKERYRNALKTMCTDNYVEDIRRRHDIDMEKLREELKQVSMHYESKCEDYKLLEDRLQRTKTDYQTHINQLVKSNEHLTVLVNTEIEQLKDFIQTRSKGRLTGNASLEEELYDSQIMVRVKDAELQKLRTQVKNHENSLERITEEQRYTMTQYLQCMKKNQELQAKLKQEVMTQRERRDSLQEDQWSKNARALRRNPSFHQRARSPSPETSTRKDSTSTEHASRDSHRRSRGHLSAKDLKRSKSSPSLPFVFDVKDIGAASRGNQAGAMGRRESAKFTSKSPKK